MKELETYIQESIFDSSAQEKVKKVHGELVLDFLKKYSYDYLDPASKKISPWENGSVKVTEKGIEVTCEKNRFRGELYIYNLPKNLPEGFKFLKVDGDIRFSNCKYMTSLDGLFTDDCAVTGNLFLLYNPKLTSLSGSPRECGWLTCKGNTSLSIAQWETGPKKIDHVFYWEWNVREGNVDPDVVELSYKKKIADHYHINPSKVIVKV